MAFVRALAAVGVVAAIRTVAVNGYSVPATVTVQENKGFVKIPVNRTTSDMGQDEDVIYYTEAKTANSNIAAGMFSCIHKCCRPIYFCL